MMTSSEETIPDSGTSGPARLERFKALRLLTGALLALYCLSSVAALGWVGLTSLKSTQEFFQSSWRLPSRLLWSNYVTAWTQAEMGRFFFNTVYITTLSTFGTVLLSAMAAYVLARVIFPLRRFLYFFFIAAMMVPAMLYIFPLFVQMRTLGLTNSHFGLILLYIATGLPFTIFVLAGFFKTLPSEMEEAALIDGASPWTTFWRIMLPLARPGLVTVCIFNFIYYWNEFLWALLLLRNEKLYTLARGLQNLYWSMSSEARWSELFAGLVIVMLPLMIIFAILQNRVTEGLTVGALKG